MIISMTGFSHSFIDFGNGNRLIAEAHSINGRFLDIQIRLPEELSYLELSFREILLKYLTRGRVDLKVFFSKKNDYYKKNLIEPNFLSTLAEQLKIVRKIIPETQPPKLLDIINLSNQMNLTEINWDNLEKKCLKLIEYSAQELQSCKSREGERILISIRPYITEIQKSLSDLEKSLPIIADKSEKKLAEKLREKMDQMFSKNSDYTLETKHIEHILLQEMSIQAIRTDISEELSRLHSHLTELDRIIYSNGSLDKKFSIGKSLDFLLQEMHREINTLGSKSNVFEVKKAVVGLKLSIEKLREQAQNIE